MPAGVSALAQNDGALIFLSAVIGLICGSFVTALSYRLPRGEDFVSGRSACPSCKTVLTPRDLIPVLSWVLSRGKCRHCATSVPIRYPAVECLSGGLFVIALVLAPAFDPVSLLLVWGLIVALLTLSVIDLEHRRLPNGLVVAVLILIVALRFYDGSTLGLVAAPALMVTSIAIALRLLGQILLAKPGLGWGDIKLGAAISCGIGPSQWAVFLAVLGAGLVVSVIVYCLACRRSGFSMKAELPLGPSLCAAALAISV